MLNYAKLDGSKTEIEENNSRCSENLYPIMFIV